MQVRELDPLVDLAPARGLLLCRAEEMEYETESGLTAVKSIKKNPKLERGVVVALGGPFMAHGRPFCRRCEPVCTRKSAPGRYWAKPGDTVWMRRGTFKKQRFQGVMYMFCPNEDIIAVKEAV